MPTFGAHFSDDEAPSVEAAAKAAGQKLAPYIAAAVRARMPVSYTHLRAHETPEHIVCRPLLEKKKNRYH